MADRITQLQDLVSQQAILFSDSVTYINEHSDPAEFPELRKHDSSGLDDKCPHFARQIAKTAKDIDEIISSVPDDIECHELQNKSMERLQKENDEITDIFKTTLSQGENLLCQIRRLLNEIGEQVMLLNEMGKTNIK